MHQLDVQPKIFATCVVAILFSAKVALASESSQSIPPFSPGERLTYKLSWGPFGVGSAFSEGKEFRNVDDECAYKFTFFVKTNPFGDLFYKVRNRYTSLAGLGLKRALVYTRRENEHKKSRNVDIIFNWYTRSVQYIREGVGRDPVPLPESALDPLSSIFAARLLELKKGANYSMNVTDGKYVEKVKIEVGKERRHRNKVGDFDVQIVTLDFGMIATAFGKKKRAFAEVWVSNDQYRVPVRMQGRAMWGTFRAELVAVKRNALPQSIFAQAGHPKMGCSEVTD